MILQVKNQRCRFKESKIKPPNLGGFIFINNKRYTYRMNKVAILVLLFILTAILYLFFVRQETEIKNYPSQNSTIVAFGDSLVEGVGSDNGEGFVGILSESIDRPIVNLGKSGDTTRDGLLRLDSVLEEDPKIVLLLFGGNDYIKRIPKEETFNNLETIITEFQSNGAIVVLLGVRGGVLKDEYKDEYKALAKRTGSAYVPDVLSGLFGRADLMADSIHPNDAGYQIIAERTHSVVMDLLD